MGFLFQAEDGIRDDLVTGVQTCALPISAAHTMLGGVYNGLLAHRQASDHFEQALVLAQETHSLFWTRVATGYLASASILLHDYARAEALLHTALSPDTAIQTLAQRILCSASVELPLAHGHPPPPLELI